MEKKKRGSWAFRHILGILAIIYGAAFLVVLLLKIDSSMVLFFSSHQNYVLRFIMIIATSFGTGSFLFLMILAIMLIAIFERKNLLKSSALYLLSVVITTIFTYAIKIIVQRDRPFNLIETGFSFPSGHSSASMAAYGVMAFLLWNKNRKLAWLALVIPLVVGFSRIYLNVHWMSDVFAGLFLGASVVFFLIGIIYQNKNSPLRRVQWALHPSLKAG